MLSGNLNNFKSMFRLFSKKKDLEGQDDSAQDVIKENQNSGLMAFLVVQFAKMKFYFYMLLCIYLIIQCCVSYYLCTQKIAINSIESDQSVMVNVTTDEIFIGSLYKDKAETTEEPRPVEGPKQNEAPAASATPAVPEPYKYRVNQLSPEDAKKAKVALIITGLGLSKNQTLEVLESKYKATLGFSPYANDLEGWVDQAVDKGYEVMLNLPMQPVDYQTNDPGAYAMLQNLDKGQNLERLENLLSYSKKVIGVYSLPNEVFSSTKSSMSDIINHLAANNIMLVYGNKKNQDDIKEACKKSSLECLSPSISSDTELNEDKIYKKLQLLENEAMKNGYSIGYLNGYPVSMRALKKWLQQLDSSKVILTPISVVLNNENLSTPSKEKDS
ncbi:MAG: hypothetical protein K0R73_721 [Candidatus Midichloriaceae bacterium]|jgi:polysaccharide deacetylase 2 family uncharacterized protein YibQ|nr:hypothetical protein [Candidatus Midichloriaceae bacterium]